jgi:tRNA-dihydrouridine synthase B
LVEVNMKSRVMLAPMAGVTDYPFRRVVREFGNFLMFSEMIASQAAIRDAKKTRRMMKGGVDDPVAVQIVGADPEVMAEASRISVDLGAEFIDINMGCPVRKVVRSESGSALMKNERLAARIMEAVVRAVAVPVSLKMRTGWDDKNKNGPRLALIAEQSGIQMIVVHGRTREQLFSGKANWLDVSSVKRSVKIPVIVNGDIKDIDTAKDALNDSGADGVMIGRASCGSPWILRDVHNFLEFGKEMAEPVPEVDKMETARRHLECMFEFYGEDVAIRLSRKVLMSYVKFKIGASEYRRTISSLSSRNEAFSLLNLTFGEPSL